MPDFLLEIGTEEIPARMIQDASQELLKRVEDLLAKSALPHQGINRSETPRRLAVTVLGIPATQPDVQEQLTGPATKVAYKDGQPTPAAHAFAKKAGVDVGQLQKVTTPKGEYLTASVTNKGKPAAQVLAELLPKEIAAIYWPKNMYWRAGKPERFVRPVRWIVAMFDGAVIPLEFAGIKAGNQSRGHRILSSGQVSITAPGQYVEIMQGAHVTALSTDREYKIRKALDAATRTVPGARWREDAELLKTVVNLTEWPSAILGSFDKEYLSLPEEVLVTVMRDHQKYFAVEDAEHKLLPHFLAVLNTDGDPDGLIRHGNERVLRARFNDARFFWDTDQKIPLVNRVEMLKAVTFQKDLGSYAAKAERMAKLAEKLCAVLAKSGQKVDGDAVQQSARLAKTDLTAELVKEFTELQGIVGGLYATAQGLPESVATAIYDQYKPESTEDSAPRTLEGAVLSIADKADSIAGMFALGLTPSGSKDPFALRRQANGIVKTIVEHKLPLNLSQIMEGAREGYKGSEAEKKFTLSGEAYIEAVRGFFRERLEFYLRDVLGLAYDVVNATLAAGADDVVDAAARASAVAKVRPSSDFESISVAFKRMKNILRQAAETKKKIAEPFNAAALKDAEEKKLAEAVPGVAKKVKELSAARQYEPALIEISRLRPAIDAFFDKVMVMVDDEELRAQRLGLLQTLVNEFSSIADFSEIVTEKKQTESQPTVCIYCGKEGTSREHVAPSSLGGNCVVRFVCQDCNKRLSVVDQALAENSPITLSKTLHTPATAFSVKLGGSAAFKDTSGKDISVRISNRMKTEVRPQLYLVGNQIQGSASDREGLNDLIRFVDMQISKDRLRQTRIVASENAEPQFLMHRSNDALVACLDQNRAQEFLMLLESQWQGIKAQLQTAAITEMKHPSPDVKVQLIMKPNDEFRGVSKIAFETTALLLGPAFVRQPEFNPIRNYILGDVRLPEPPPENDVAVDTRFVSRLQSFQLGFTEQHGVLLYCSPPDFIAFVLLYGEHPYLVRLAQLPGQQQFLRAYEFSYVKEGHGEISELEFASRLLKRSPQILGLNSNEVDALIQQLRTQGR